MRDIRSISLLLMIASLACVEAGRNGVEPPPATNMIGGIWIHMYSEWTEAPEFTGYTRWTPASLVSFEADGRVTLVVGLLLGGEKGYSISPGDGVVISLGYWKEEGRDDEIVLSTVKVSETVARVGGSDIFRDIKRSVVVLESAKTLRIDGATYERNPIVEVDYFHYFTGDVWSYYQERLQEVFRRKGGIDS